MANYSFNESICIAEIKKSPDNINFTRVARACELKNKSNQFPKNGGQIIKHYLKNVSTTVPSDITIPPTKERVRRKKIRYS